MNKANWLECTAKLAHMMAGTGKIVVTGKFDEERTMTWFRNGKPVVKKVLTSSRMEDSSYYYNGILFYGP